MIKKLIILFEIVFIGGVLSALYFAYNKAQIGMTISGALGYLDAIEKQAIVNSMDLDDLNDITTGTFNIKNYNITYIGNKPTNCIFEVNNNIVKRALLQYEIYNNTKYVCYDNQKSKVYDEITENDNCFDLYTELKK